MIFIKQGDRRPAAPATIKRGDTIVDLTDATSVVFSMRPIYRVDYTIEEAAAYVVDAVAGEVEYRWVEGDTDWAGDHYATWLVTWSDGTTESFPTIGYDVVHIDANLSGGL